MAGGSGTRFVDKLKYLTALHGVVPSSSSPKWVSLKGFNHLTAIVTYKNTSTGVTGSAIGLAQATAVAGTSAKALPFTTMFACVGDSSTAALVQTAVVSNTFTTDNTGSGTGFYVIEFDAVEADIADGFDCIQVTTGNAVNATIEVSYILGNTPRYSGSYDAFMNPLAD